MRGNKKGMFIFDTFVETIIVVVLLIFVFNIGKRVAEAAGFGQNNLANLEEEFNKFVKNIDNVQVGPESQIFVNLYPNTAIIGFSKNADSFKCIACGSSTSKDIISFFNKPQNKECKEGSCICLCPHSIQIDTSKEPPLEMKCENMICKPLKDDLAESIELSKYFEQFERTEPLRYSNIKYARWAGGFLFERHSRSNFISNGLPPQQNTRSVIFAQKKNDNGVYTVICPVSNCNSMYIQNKEPKVPPNTCRIIIDCTKKQTATKKQSTIIVGNYDYCNLVAHRITLKYFDEDDCKTVMECVKKQINFDAECKNVDGDYVFSYDK